MMDKGREFGYFCLGCTVGVVMAVLFAPKSGKQTMEYLSEKANEGADFAKRRIDEAQESINDATARAKKTVNDQADRMSAAVKAGRQAYRSAGQTAT